MPVFELLRIGLPMYGQAEQIEELADKREEHQIPRPVSARLLLAVVCMALPPNQNGTEFLPCHCTILCKGCQ